MVRYLIFALLFVSLPFWVLLKRKFGPRFAAVLFGMAVILSGGYFAYTMTSANELYPALLPHLSHPFVGQLMAALLIVATFSFLHDALFFPYIHRSASLLQHPWGAGQFHLWKPLNIATDILLVAALAFYAYGFSQSEMAMVGHSRLPGWISQYVAIVGPIYLLTTYVARANGNTMPLDPPPPRARVSKPARPFMTALRSMPRGARDDLAMIFSRRHPELKKISG